MSAGAMPVAPPLPATPWGHLPPQLRVLLITGEPRIGTGLAAALGQDKAAEIQLEVAASAAAGLARLRDEAFDAVLISDEPGVIDAAELVEAIRTGSHDEQPILVLDRGEEPQLTALCYDAGADACVCLRTATTRALIWHVARAVERQELLAENRRLQLVRRQQLDAERDDADRRLRQQRQLLESLPPPAADGPRLPADLADHYRELLRTCIMMGGGDPPAELESLVQVLWAGDVSPREVLALHATAVAELVGGLGSRSARHVLNRADLLILEVMSRLVEESRRLPHPPPGTDA
ncbi:MAG: response regulator transcription factor [Pirellulaceae bacterium]|nr:response regulator transcription factor [Pirellulaceae bacterium]